MTEEELQNLMVMEDAEQGDVLAQFRLGCCYYNGEGVEQDYEKAFHWYEKSAEQGNADAQYCLGICYYNGKGVAQDYEESFYWYEKSAEHGNTNAQYWLGECYYDGEDVEQDYEKAVYWLTKSAENGNEDAIELLNKIMEEKSKELMEKAEQGDAKAQSDLGKYYLETADKNNFEENYNQAVDWFRKSAAQKCSSGLYNLGLCYKNGLGVEEDQDRAIAYILEAAKDEEMVLAIMEIASYYAIQEDFEQAIKWYLKASEKNLPEAFNALGYIYLNGCGVEKDIEKAIEYLDKASDGNDDNAMNLLGTIYSDEDSDYYNLEKALQYFFKAAELGNPYAMLNIGDIYLESEDDGNFKIGLEYILNAVDSWAEQQPDNSYAVYPSDWQNEAHEKLWNFFNEYDKRCDILDILEDLANTGNRAAQYYVYTFKQETYGLELYNPDNIESKQVSKDLSKWLLSSADAGFPNAQYELGIHYHDGIGGVEKNIDKGIHYLLAAAEQGHYGAAYYLNSLKRK